jgi:hypothetical protein
MRTNRYMFVVKDAESKSFSRSDDQERSQIHRHVSIRTIQQKRAPEQPDDQFQDLRVVEVDPHAPIMRRRQTKSRSNRTSRSSTSSAVAIPACRCDRAATEPCPIHAIPRMPTGELCVIDPFASTAVNIDSQAHSLLQYFVHVSHPRTWQSEVQNDSYTFQRDAVTLVRGSFEEEVHFYTLLASMASQMHHFDHMHQDGHSTNLLATKAIVAVRNHLNTTHVVDQRLVFDIHQLAVTEFYRYELDSAHIHLRAVKALLESLGGIENIDPALREWIVFGDGFVAAERLSKPIFSASTFDPGELYSERRQALIQHCFSASPISQESKYRQLLPGPLRNTLVDLAVAVQTIQQRSELASPVGEAIGENATRHWLLLRTTAIRHQLLELEVEDERINAIRIAVIMWLFLTMTVTGRQRTARVLSLKLQVALESIERASKLAGWTGFEDALLWITLTGAMASNVVGRHWYLTLAKKLILANDVPGVSADPTTLTETTLVKFCGRFFYLDEVQQPMIRTLVADLTHRIAPPEWKIKTED